MRERKKGKKERKDKRKVRERKKRGRRKEKEKEITWKETTILSRDSVPFSLSLLPENEIPKEGESLFSSVWFYDSFFFPLHPFPFSYSDRPAISPFIREMIERGRKSDKEKERERRREWQW